jgi:hypothetical protein
MALDGTYDGLKDSVTSWAMRTDDDEFIAAVPDMITLAEKRLNAAISESGSEVVSTATLDANQQVLLPTDYLRFRSIVTTSQPIVELDIVDPGWVASEFPSGISGLGAPYATITGRTLTVLKAGVTEVKMTYYKGITALSDSNPTNWLLTSSPDLYLYACLIEAAPFMMSDSRAQVWGTLYEKALENFRDMDRAARRSRMRSRPRGATP